MSELVKRPVFAIVAEVLGYVSGGLVVLGSLAEGGPGALGLLIGIGLIAMSVMMRNGKNWARITATALSGLLALVFFASMSDKNISDEVAGVSFVMLVIVVCEVVFSWLPSVNKWFGSMNSHSSSSNI